MKIYKYILLLGLSVAMFASCEKPSGPQVGSEAQAPQFTTQAPGDDQVLRQSEQDNVFMSFAWSAADFGLDVVNDYSLELDIQGGGFERPTVITTTRNTSVDVLVKEFNQAMIDHGITAGQQAQVIVRVVANKHLDSDAIAMNVTGYFSVVPWGIIGSSTPQGWDADTDMEYIPADANDPANTANSTWEITLDMKSGEYKFRYNDSWDLNFGSTEGEPDDAIEIQDLPLTENGGNLKLTEGNYTFTMKLVGAVNAPNSIALDIVQNSAPEPSPQDDKWGLIGNAYNIYDENGEIVRMGEWGDMDDIPMNFVSVENEVYTYAINTITLLADGQFKFRKDNDWAVNFGYDGATTTGDASNFVQSAADNNWQVLSTNTYQVLQMYDAVNNTRTIEFVTADMFNYGLIGNAYDVNGGQADWGDNDDLPFTFSRMEGEFFVYEIASVAIRAGGEFKIRRDGKWDENYGYDQMTIEGDADNFTNFDGNFNAAEGKTYKIEFKFDFAGNMRTIVFTPL